MKILQVSPGYFPAIGGVEEHVQVDRLKEAKATGADLLVTACPKCQIHFRCAMKDPNISGEIEIEMQDVSQLVADALA